MSDPNRDPPRPRDVRGLLKFCTEVTAREDTTGPSQLSQLDDERKAFLEEVLTGLTAGVAQKIAKALKCLTSEVTYLSGEDIGEQEEALQDLEEYADDINYAIDIQNMGGFHVLIGCLESPHSKIRCGAASLIGDLVQNNSKGQEEMLTLGAVLKFLRMLDTDVEEKCRVKSLYALSCLARDCPEGEKQFVESGGFSYLMRAMQSGIEKLVVKSTFLLSNIAQKNETYKDEIIGMGYIEQLSTLLNMETTSDVTREHCTAALVRLASSYHLALAECLRPELNIRRTFAVRLETIKGKEQYKEEEDYITEFFRLLPEDDPEENIR
ncbi:hsp70-binding protein 1 isoform X2 [Oratosquilla oratoria]|uniref:hsp70-binding protein 1 isoform X2 n=1 Tax=Oratosquilla oratoria TaxID=337810 RepID=UPI003F76CD46